MLQKILSNKYRWIVANEINRRFLYDRGMQIKKLQKPMSNRLANGPFLERQESQIAEAVCAFLKEFFPENDDINSARVLDWIQDFDRLFRNAPFAENNGGSHYNDAIWLYIIARTLKPEMIAECGTFKGFSIWMLSQAAPRSERHTFDIIMDNLQLKLPDVEYHHSDWSEVDLRAKGKSDLCFFDDHYDQAQRIIEAHDRGFRYAIFDDCYDAQAVYKTGWPPIPSIPMLYDEQIQDGDLLEWFRNGKRKKHTFDLQHHEAAKKRINRWSYFPELDSINRYGLHSGLCIVELTS